MNWELDSMANSSTSMGYNSCKESRRGWPENGEKSYPGEVC